jgi:hypothetical protein
MATEDAEVRRDFFFILDSFMVAMRGKSWDSTLNSILDAAGNSRRCIPSGEETHLATRFGGEPLDREGLS